MKLPQPKATLTPLVMLRRKRAARDVKNIFEVSGFSMHSVKRSYTAIPIKSLPQRKQNNDHPINKSASAVESSLRATIQKQENNATPSSSPSWTALRRAVPRSLRELDTSLKASSSASSSSVLPLSSTVRCEGEKPCTAVMPCVKFLRLPRILFFGGDAVSVTALEALHTRMLCVVQRALACETGTLDKNHAKERETAENGALRYEDFPAAVRDLVREHLTVICPSLPRHTTPAEAAKKYSRQYPVARYAVEHDLPVIPVDDPRSLTKSRLLVELLSKSVGAPSCGKGPRDTETPSWRTHGRPLSDFDLTVVVSFRYFLPKRLLRVLPPVINMHPSLLPKYRGASPIFSALLHNEPVGGVSIIQMRADQQGMDSGSVLWQCEVPITPDTDIRLYFPLVTQIGAAGLCDTIFGEAGGPMRACGLQQKEMEKIEREKTGEREIGAPQEKEQSLFPSAESGSFFGLGGSAQWPMFSWPSTSFFQEQLERMEKFSSGFSTFLHFKQQAVQDQAVRRRTDMQQSLWATLRSRDLRPVVHHPSMATTAQTSSFSMTSSSVSSEGKFTTSMATTTSTTSWSSFVNTGSGPPTPHAPIPPGAHWATLCRAVSQLTPAAIQQASNTHRALFFQNLASSVDQTTANRPATKKKVSTVSAGALDLTTTMKCAEVFPCSVLSPYCDWPHSFTYSWKFAQEQRYTTFSRYSDDPYHAPLLGKDAALLCFSCYDGWKAYGVWRAFAGGEYYHPSVNATLDKACTPVRNQLVRRAVRRLLREKAKARRKAAPPQGDGTADKQAPRPKPPAVTTVLVEAGEGEEDPVPLGHMTGHHVELNVFHCAGYNLLVEAEASLRTPCTFVQALHPSLVPAAVVAELQAVEDGTHPHARFYRAPPPLFRCLLEGSSPCTDPEGKPSKVRSGSQQMDPTSMSGAAPVRTAKESQKKKRRQGSSEGDGDEMEEEDNPEAEAPVGYVPGVIHAPPPLPSLCSLSCGGLSGAGAAEGGGSPARWRRHIPPGTGYFPEADENVGAIKCQEGWLVWCHVHLKAANKPQPASLIRKGLAMKTGILYAGLFSEYS